MATYDEKPWLKSYDAGLDPEVTISDHTYASLLEDAMVRHPERPAMYFMGVSFSYGRFDELSRRFAAFLAANGIGTGDVVGINLPNIPQYLIALTGALRAGCVVTGISPLLTPKEMAYQINDAGARALVTLDAIYEHRVQAVRNEVSGLDICVAASIGDYLPAVKRILGKLLKKIPSGRLDPIPGKTVVSFKDALASAEPAPPRADITPDDICLLQYTGGTTGLPKGTQLTHRNITVNISQILNWLDFHPDREVMCSAFPLFHLAGLMVGMASLAAAIPQILIPDPRNTGHICGEIGKYRPTLLTNVPSLYQMLLEAPEFHALDFSNTKACVSGAAPFAVEAIQAMEKVVGREKVLEVYGMTETSPILTMNPFRGRKKIGSVGIPVQSTRIKLVDVETGTREVPLGEEGELIANGPQVMKGYHNKPEETAHALREFQGERWLYTGDVARMDEDGYFTIADRVKDMLIVGGFKVFSREVEEKLYEHPGVEFCAIVGLPNPDRPGSEIVKAVVQRSEAGRENSEDGLKADIIAFCRENMAPYKVPKIVEFIGQIPLTAVGKVDKKALR
ncbi:MAG: long-chain fatty acid--CoA ligase [Desulfobacterales bacterium]|nr:long-chain fatty acid--CoA ligase [Desulfobacterales bacterium]